MGNPTDAMQLTQESNKPWMTLSNWVYLDKITMWLKINTVWYKIRVIPLYWVNAWIHVCMHTDTISKNISISLNGELSSWKLARAP